ILYIEYKKRYSIEKKTSFKSDYKLKEFFEKSTKYVSQKKRIKLNKKDINDKLNCFEIFVQYILNNIIPVYSNYFTED
ncbi:hypothetical protein ACFL2K_05180, partial [Candidatus Margulisiibacteriota bacterium]